MANSRGGWLLGLGINYLLVNIPLVIFCKYGYTGLNVGVKKRTAGINKDMPGFPIPVFFVITFFAYDVEQAVHRLMKPLRANFYKGSGHTETYWVLALLPAFCIMVVLWGINALLVYGVWKLITPYLCHSVR
jgi:hypothetical protein